MEDYKYIEKREEVPILINQKEEIVCLSDIFGDLYGQKDGRITHGMEEGQVAEKYDLTESQVAEAESFFRTDEAERFWENIEDLCYSGNPAIEPVENAFYGLASEHDDLVVEVEERPDSADIEYGLHIGENVLQVAVEGSNAYLHDDNSVATLKVEQGRIEDEIITLYNGLRLQNE